MYPIYYNNFNIFDIQILTYFNNFNFKLINSLK